MSYYVLGVFFFPLVPGLLLSSAAICLTHPKSLRNSSSSILGPHLIQCAYYLHVNYVITRGSVHKIPALRGENPSARTALSCSSGALRGCPTDAPEAEEALTTAAALASHEPGFWLSLTPPVGTH